jgi:adenine-specific DNA-methyltransferase
MQDMKAELSKIGSSTMYPLGAIGRWPNKAASSSASDVNEFWWS